MIQQNAYPKNKEPYQTIQTKNFQKLQLQLWSALDNPDRTEIDNFAIHLYHQIVDFESYWEQEARSLQDDIYDLQSEIDNLNDELYIETCEKNKLDDIVNELEENNKKLLDKIDILETKIRNL